MAERTTAVGLLLLSLALGNAFGAEGPSPALTDAELADLVSSLDDAQDGLMGRISGLTDAQWRFKQNPDRWSVGECAEHIVLAEAALLGKIQKLIAGPSDPEWFSHTDGQLARIRQFVPNRPAQGQGGVKAPVELEPTQHWDRSRAIQEFYRVHGEVRSFVETMDRAIKDRTESSPPFGWLNAHDSLVSLALHTVRHTRQIAEVQADPGYPVKPAAVTGADPNPDVTDAEFTALVKEIDDAQDLILRRISGMTDEQWTFRENPDRWSVGECVEHVARGPSAILGGISYYLTQPPNPAWAEQTKGKLELVHQAVLSRNRGGAGSPFKAPYEVQPTEKWDRARGIRELYRSFGELRAFVETMPPGIKSRTFMNPFPQIGLLNAHDWLTLSALHAMRHTQQIIEVQEDPNYPKKTAIDPSASSSPHP